MRQAREGHVQSLRDRALAQPATKQPRPATPALLTSPAGPLTTRTVFPQEAGGMLERVESRRQKATQTEPDPPGKGAKRAPEEGRSVQGTQGRAGCQEPHEAQTPKEDPPLPSPTRTPETGLCQRRRQGNERAKGEDPPTTASSQMETCPLVQTSAGPAQGVNSVGFPR